MQGLWLEDLLSNPVDSGNGSNEHASGWTTGGGGGHGHAAAVRICERRIAMADPARVLLHRITLRDQDLNP